MYPINLGSILAVTVVTHVVCRTRSGVYSIPRSPSTTAAVTHVVNTLLSHAVHAGSRQPGRSRSCQCKEGQWSCPSSCNLDLNVSILCVCVCEQFTTVETLVSGLVDQFPKYLRHRKFAFTAFVCLVEFTLGLPLVTQVCRHNITYPVELR